VAIDIDRLLNWPFEDVVQTYTERDTMLYALGIGLGADPVDEAQLRFVFEKGLVAFPTLPVVLGRSARGLADPSSGITYKKVVHGEQSVILHRPAPIAGVIRARDRVTGVIDKGEGRGALVYTERRIIDHKTEEPIATLASTTFARADGGFGGPTGPVLPPHPMPSGAPHKVEELVTRPEAALVYRLSGDYNPLHADPKLAKEAGFPRPILHGLCTFGVAAHAVLKTYGGYRPETLREFAARFSSPVFPGETIAVEMWREGNIVSFRAFVRARDVKVLDNGRAVLVE
jgi:acyl dehydratase